MSSRWRPGRRHTEYNTLHERSFSGVARPAWSRRRTVERVNNSAFSALFVCPSKWSPGAR